MEWVVSLLWKQWGLPLEINKRDDILYKGHKVGIIWDYMTFIGVSPCQTNKALVVRWEEGDALVVRWEKGEALVMRWKGGDALLVTLLPLSYHSTTQLKVSGSAARLTSSASFHHFTLLLNTDIEQLQRYLRRKQV